jgi:hypothetical protein
MATIAEMREQWAAENAGVDPYAHLSDRELADAIYDTHYAEHMQRAEYDSRIGYQPGAGERIKRAVLGAGPLDEGLFDVVADAFNSREDQTAGAATWADTLRSAGTSARAGAARAIAGARLKHLESEPVGLARQAIDAGLAEEPGDRSQEIADELAIIDETIAGQQESMPEGMDVVQRGVHSAIASGPAMLGALGVGIATRNPTLAAGTMFPTTESETYARMRAEGIDPAIAGKHATAQGAIEVGTELLPFGALLSKLPGGKKFLATILADLPGEAAATLLQGGSDYVAAQEAAGKEPTPEMALEGIRQALPQLPETVVATLVTAGGTVGLMRAIDAPRERRERREADAAAYEAARQAELDQMASEGMFGVKPRPPFDGGAGTDQPGAGNPPGAPPGSPPGAAPALPPSDTLEDLGPAKEYLKTPAARQMFQTWRELTKRIQAATETFKNLPMGSPEQAEFYNTVIFPMAKRAYEIDNVHLAKELTGKPIDPGLRKPPPEKLKPDPNYGKAPEQPAAQPTEAAAAPAAATPPPASPAAAAAPEASTEAEAAPGLDMDAEVASLMAQPGEREAAGERIRAMQEELLEQPGPEGMGPAPAAAARDDIPVESEESIRARLDQAPRSKAPARDRVSAYERAFKSRERVSRELSDLEYEARERVLRRLPPEHPLRKDSFKAENRAEINRLVDEELAPQAEERKRLRSAKAAAILEERRTERDLPQPVGEAERIAFKDSKRSSAEILMRQYEGGVWTFANSVQLPTSGSSSPLSVVWNRELFDTREEALAAATKQLRASLAGSAKNQESPSTRKAAIELLAKMDKTPKPKAAPKPKEEPAAEPQDPAGKRLTPAQDSAIAQIRKLATRDPPQFTFGEILGLEIAGSGKTGTAGQPVTGGKITVNTVNQLIAKGALVVVKKNADFLKTALRLNSERQPTAPISQAEESGSDQAPDAAAVEALRAAAFTTLGVPCPTCGAKAGSPCKRPSGHTTQDPHKARNEKADALFVATYGEEAIIDYDAGADRWGVRGTVNGPFVAHSTKFGPQNDLDAPRKKKKPDQRGKRPLPDPSRMDLLEYLATIGEGGKFGLSWEEASAQGLDPEDMRDAYVFGIYRPFVKGGMSFDRAAELLDEAGFPVTETIGGQERYTANKLLEILSRALAGEKIYSSSNTEAFEQMHERREFDAAQAEELDAAAGSNGTVKWQFELLERYESEMADAREWARELEDQEARTEYERNKSLLEDAIAAKDFELAVQYMANVNAIAGTLKLPRVSPAQYGFTAWPSKVAEEGPEYRPDVHTELDLFGQPIRIVVTPRSRPSQNDLFGGTPESQEATQRRIDLEARRQEIEARLQGDKSIPEDINNGDLFSRQIDLTDITPAPVRRADPQPGEIDIVLPAAPKPELDARFKDIASRVGLTSYGIVDAPAKVNTPRKALELVRGVLGNKPQEQFLAIAVDAEHRPIAVVRHTIGLTDQSMVQPSMAVGPLFDLEGVAGVIFAHQHPSGVPEASHADEHITHKLRELLEGTSIRFLGHAIVGVGRDSGAWIDSFGATTNNLNIGVREEAERSKLPLLERIFDVVKPGASEPLTGPMQTTQYLRREDFGTGILFLDTRHKPVAFLKMTKDQLRRLKTEEPDTGVSVLLRTMHQVNANKAIVVVEAENRNALANVEAIKNVAIAVRRADGQILDGFVVVRDPETDDLAITSMYELNRDAIDYPGTVLAANPIREIAKLYQKLIAKPLIDYWNNHVGWRYHPLKQLPEMNKFLQLRYRLLGSIDKVSRHVARDVFDVFSEARGTPDELAIFHYLTTRGASPNVITDPQLRVKAMAVKRLFRNIGREWVKLGVLSRQAVAGMADQYLPRLYLRHILGHSAFAEYGAGRKPSKMGWRRKRNDIDQLTRDIVLGQIKDPSFLAAVGLGTQLRDLHVLQFLHAISANQNWVQSTQFVMWSGMRVTPQWLMSEADHIEQQSEYYLPADRQTALGMAAIMRQQARNTLGRTIAIDPALWRQLPDTARYGHLRGAWVRKEIFDDLMGIDTILPPDASMVERLLSPSSTSGRISAWWKTTRVTLNPPTQVRNFMSNLILLHLSGVPSYRIFSGELIARVLRDRVKGGKYYRIAEKYGLFATTFSAQELANVESEFLKIQLQMRRGGLRGSLAHARAIGEAIVKGAGNAYSMIEYLAKMAKVIDAMEREGLTEQEAMLEAQKWLFDYSLVPRTLRFLRNAPIGAPFLTFMYKAAPRIGEAMLMRPWTMAVYMAALPMLMTIFFGMLAGDEVDKDDIDDMKRLMPEWAQKRGNLLFLPIRDQLGRWQFLDLGFLVPWGMFSDMGKIIQSSMPLGEKVNELRKTMGVGGGPILDPLIATMTGVDPFRGTPIANESDPPSMQAAAYLSFMANVWIPPWLHGLATPQGSGHLKNVKDALTGDNVNYRTHEPSRTVGQATAALFGLTTVPVSEAYDPAALLRGMAFEISEVERRRDLAIRKATSEQERAEIVELYRLEIERRKARINEVNAARERLQNRSARDGA